MAESRRMSNGIAGHAWPLGRIAGIPIRIDRSWFLIFALITWTLAAGYYPAQFRGWPGWQYWAIAALTAILFFASVLFHELSHSLVARGFGMPVRSITLFIFGGVSQLGGSATSARSEFLIAVVGPASSLLLAGVFHLLEPVTAGATPVLALVTYLAYINAALGFFNLIPGFPLDGGRVFKAVVWAVTHDARRALQIAGTVGRGIGYVFILFGVWQVFGGNFVNGLWISFIGWFLENAAVAEMQGQAILDALAGHRVAEAMRRDYVSVPSDHTLQELVDAHVFAHGRRSFVVEDGGVVVGLLTLHQMTTAPRASWPVTTAAEVMIPRAQMRTTRADADLRSVLEAMDQDGVNQLPVIDGEHVIGMLTRADVIGFLRQPDLWPR